jgi:hypothetical protein
MIETVYMVEQIDYQRARILSAHASLDLAQRKIARLIAVTHPKVGWHEDPNLKRMSANHGDTVTVWARDHMPVTERFNLVVSYAVVKFVIDDPVIERLAELAND